MRCPGRHWKKRRADIACAIEYAPPHLSFYHLTIEPNTYSIAIRRSVPDDDTAAEMQDVDGVSAREAGYEHYETSAYAMHGFRCRHNLNYWTFGDYLGIGAGAHGKLTFPDRIVREARYRQPREYMESALAGSAVQSDETVAARDIAFEFMMNALRLNDGFPAVAFRRAHGAAARSVTRARQGGAKGPPRARPRARRADGAGKAFPQRSAPDVPARKGPPPRCGGERQAAPRKRT